MKTTFIDFLIFANGAILLFLGFIQISYKRKVLNNYLAILLFSLTGYMILYNWSFKTRFIYQFPFLLNGDIIVSYILAPCIYLYFRSISNKPTQTFRHYLPYFFPAVAVLLISIAYNLARPEIAAAYFATNPTTPPYLQKNLLSYLNSFGDIAVAAAFMYAFLENRILFRKKNLLKSSEFKVVFVFITCMIIDSLLVILAELADNPKLMLFALNGYGIILIGYSFFTYRYPEFMQIVLKEVKAIKYEQSTLQHININEKKNILEQLMRRDKLFKDDNLSLAKVSSLLGITKHQLSELINTQYSLTFPAFVNSHRIREAKTLLRNDKKLTIIEIAYASGFNSKPAFNTAFSEQVQCTPTEYRKKAKA